MGSSGSTRISINSVTSASSFADEWPLEESVIPMAPGDLVLMYTDGVTDMQAPGGERFGDARLIAAVETARSGTAAEMVAAIAEACRRFQDGVAAADDVAIVAIRREPRRTRATRRRSPG